MGKEQMEKRTVKQMIEMVVSERLDVILQEKSDDADIETMDHGEAVIDSLPDDQKETIQAYLNTLLDHEAQSNEKAYLGGFHDAIGLLIRLLVIAADYDK